MTHEETEALSAYIDGALEASERARVEAHLSVCPDCSDRKDAIERVVATLASIPDVSPTADESRAIRRALEEATTSPRLAPRFWTAAGAAAFLLVATLGYVFMRGGPSIDSVTEERGEGLASGAAIPPIDFQSEDEVKEVVAAQPEVTSALARYRVSDVGASQEEVVAALPEPITAGEAQAETTDRSFFSRAATAPTPSPTRTASECLRTILRSQPYPLMPVMARSATYRGTPAWLLVYVWTNKSDDPDARLDMLQIWLVDRDQCSPLLYQQLRP